MSLVAYLLGCALLLGLAYRLARPRLASWVGLDDRRPTPAHAEPDDDRHPARAGALLPQHFSAIAAAGPVVGPILAGSLFGWGPTLAWILLGAILIGGLHDFLALVASIRNKGRTIAELVRLHASPLSHRLFLGFIWISLVYVIVAFADVTAGTFVARGAPGEDAPGPAVASASVGYLLLAVAMGLAVRRGLRGDTARWVFLPLVAVVIGLGQAFPLDLGDARAWTLVLLAYCALASMAPVWLLLQPRGELGGWFLYGVIAVASAGLVIGGLGGSLEIKAPFITDAPLLGDLAGAAPILPILLITVACGACSGFHAIVASGTTSRQLDKESDAVPVAYGGMLLEAFFAALTLAVFCVVGGMAGSPDRTYAQGIALLAETATFGLIPQAVALPVALLGFATFVFDTLDACTRLARYTLCELLGLTGKAGAWFATLATLAIPAALAFLPKVTQGGAEVPLWRTFWTIFGMSNQLLAALALLAVTLWLRSEGRRWWPAFAPALVMLLAAGSALTLLLHARLTGGPLSAVAAAETGCAALLLALALLLLAESVRFLRKPAEAAAQGPGGSGAQGLGS
jgi:carbon starvation protein